MYITQVCENDLRFLAGLQIYKQDESTSQEERPASQSSQPLKD